MEPRDGISVLAGRGQDQVPSAPRTHSGKAAIAVQAELCQEPDLPVP